ncbi:MAG: carboxypeptidase-like regulatory domain-containing protein [Actinomycetota bacterium]
MFRSFTRSIATVASVATIGLFAIPEVAHAANVELTITDADGVAIPRAMVAVLNTDGDAIDSAIADANGKVTVKDDSATGYVVAAPGFGTKVVESAPAAGGSVKLTASTKSKLSFSNAYGGQVRTLAGDAESGVFYATSDAQPSVWRTSDYAGTWSPVPTSAEDTEASASAAGGMTQQQSAGDIFTSEAKGEVAVQVGSDLYYSRTYGSTWTKISSYSEVKGQNKKHYWVHGGAQEENSYIFVRTDDALWAAVMPDSKSDSAPTFANVSSSIGRFNPRDRVAFARGSGGEMYMAAINGAGIQVSQLNGVTAAAAIRATAVSFTSGPTMTLATTGVGLIQMSTLGTATPQVIISHLVDNTTKTVQVSKNNSGTWANNTVLKKAGNNDNNFTTVTDIAGICGQNGGTPLVASIAPVAPAAGVLNGFDAVGTIGQCMWAYNSTGSDVTVGSAHAAGTLILAEMNGANNNTGFVWDSAYNFSTNMVAISGDGQFGVRKSANLDATTGYRPLFGQAGGTTANNYTNFQAAAGPATTSGGIAVNGMTAPNVTDIAYDPNSTDGSKFILSMTGSGGSRTLLTTDGGTSFSTVGAGGSYAVEWWNGAGDTQYIAAGFTNNPNEFLHVKGFTTATGTLKTQMSEELAATAAERDAKDPTVRKEFVFEGPANPSGSTLTPTSFVSSGGQQLLAAIEGVAGKDMMLVAVNKCSGNVGPTGCESSAGSVALISVATNSSTGATTLSNIKYFGSAAASGGAATAGTGTYTAGVKAIQYCPTGAATKVADTAFISVGGKGLYKISAVTTAPSHSATATTTGTYSDMKIDCDTGVIAVAGTDGAYLSIDGGAKFFQLKTEAAQANQPSPPPGGQGNGPTAIAVQADATTGDLTVAVGSGNGDVKSIETTFTDIGLKASDVAAGTATSPTAAVTPKTDQINEVNSSSNGRNTGSVPDMELPPASGDKVDVASVKVFTVRASASAGVKLSVGAGGGAFKAAVKNGSITAPSAGAAPATNQPAANQPAANQPTATAPKTVTIAPKKSITVASALKTLGTTVVAKSKLVTTSTTKSVCSVLPGNKVQGLKAGICKLTVKITPPATKAVPKPKTTTKKVSITIK